MGRPKGSKNKVQGLTPSELMIVQNALRNVGKTARMTAIEAVDRAQFKSAVEGGVTAQRDYQNRIIRLEQKREASITDCLVRAEGYIAFWDGIKRQSDPEDWAEFEPGLLPHPDDLEVDFDARTVRCHGPASSLEKRKFDQGTRAGAELREKILAMREEAFDRAGDRAFQWRIVIYTDKFLSVNEALPDRYKLEWLPIWQSDHIPEPWKMGPDVDWSGAENTI